MRSGSRTCVFCGVGGKLTREHVFAEWLRHIGLPSEPTRHGVGPLNRSLRDFGVTPPFLRTVRDVCGPCNHGWMSALEGTAKRVLTPLITGYEGVVPAVDHGAIAAWLQKTALVVMLMSSHEERAQGRGLPAGEYRELHTLREQRLPLPRTQVWIGQYGGQRHLGSTWVTPVVVHVEGLPEPESPHGYVITLVLGKVLLQAVRFTAPSFEVEMRAAGGLAQLWPSGGDVAWPIGGEISDERIVGVSLGKNLGPAHLGLTLQPWRPATELPRSETDGSLVRLPTPCGQHFVCYPAALMAAAFHGMFHTFVTSCECGKVYLVETQHDGAHFSMEAEEDGVPALLERYEETTGEEGVFRDPNGQFFFRRTLPREAHAAP